MKGNVMATLYDMELQESNNFIHALMKQGETPAIMLLNDQRKMAESMGSTGQEMLAQLDDPNSEIGKSYQRLKQLQKDIQEVMVTAKLTAEMVKTAQGIFSKNPDSLTSLTEAEQEVIKSYWLKKKTCITILVGKGYTHEELFS